MDKENEFIEWDVQLSQLTSKDGFCTELTEMPE
jgi:hypothetical protein